MTREEFERGFHSRTLAYHPEYRLDDRPVVVRLGQGADCPPGHLLAVTLVNLLARAHRRIAIVGDVRRPLRCVDHFGFGTLDEATLGLARAINPFIDLLTDERALEHDPLVTIGIAASGDLRLGCDGWCAHVGPAADIDPQPKSMLGAALAACLGASAAFHSAIGNTEVPAGAWSLWEAGRRSTEQGPELDGPIDVGRVLQVGAGAVGCALDYWLRFCGFVGGWTIVDGDIVDVSNLNRQVLFLASDAGFPDGPCGNKAEKVVRRLGSSAAASPHWYGVDPAVVEGAYDVVLPLANEHGVRRVLQARAQTVLLHATTTPSWRALSHRHVAGRDDCLICRLPEQEPTGFACSTAQVGKEKQADASLPFLSAMAGLLLLSNLIRLQHGQLLERRANFTALDLRSPVPIFDEKTWRCQEGCRAWMPAPARLRRTSGSRFARLDGCWPIAPPNPC